MENITDPSKHQYAIELMQQLDNFRNPATAGASSELQVFQKWINFVRHWLVYCAAYGFTHNYQEIMEGNFFREIIIGTYHEGTMDILKNSMTRFTFCLSPILKLELSAETIIEDLLERFVPAAIDWEVSSASRITKRKAE